MTKPILTIPTIAAALLLGVAPLALAAPQTPAENGYAPNGAPTENIPAENGSPSNGAQAHQPQAMIQSFEHASVSLPQAIQTAEKRSNGKAVDADFGMGPNGKPIYRITTYQNNSLAVHDIDASTGKLVSYKGEISPSQLTPAGQNQLKAANNAKMPLRDAIKTAEQQNGGKALSGGLEAQNGEAFYAVTLLKNGQPKNVRLNPQTGELAAVPLNRLNNSQNNPENENNSEDNSETSPENNPESNPETIPQNGPQNSPQGNPQNNGMPNQQ